GDHAEISPEHAYIIDAAPRDRSVDEVVGLGPSAWVHAPERFRVGVRAEELWIRFNVRNESGNPTIVIGERNGISRFDVWVSRNGTVEYVGFSGWRAGPGRSSVVSPRAIAAMPVRIEQNETATIFVRIPGDGGAPPRLFASAPASFFIKNAQRMLLQGTGMGFTTMMAAFSLMLVVSLRRTDIVVYSLLTILSVVLVNYANGFGPMVVWAEYPTLARLIAKSIVLVYTLVAAEFFRRFLKPEPHQTGILRAILIFEICLLLYILRILLTPLDTDIQSTAFVSPIAFLLLLVIVSVGVRAGVENSRPLLASGLGTILVGIITYLNNLGLDLFPLSLELDQGLMVTVAIQVQSAVIAATIVGSAEFRLSRERLQRQQAEQQVVDLRTQAIEAERMSNIATLVGSVSHELGTPLGIGVTLGSDLVSRTRLLSEQFENETMTRSTFQGYLEMVAESGEMIEEHMTRARELIDGFRAIAADQAVLAPREIDLADYLTRLIRSVQPRFKHTPHQLKLVVDDEPRVLTVPGYLSQVIINLVNNSLRHGFSEDMRGTVTVSARALPQDTQGCRRVEIHVGDDGIGIPAAIRSRIFEPYFTTAADSGGTGLGLSIVKNLMEHDLHGSIELLPAGNAGTQFRLEITDIGPCNTETDVQGDSQ
ncbi:MAG: ATP-binding protein, partial [Spirochaetota bacterium]